MKTTLVVIACLLTLTTSVHKTTELFPSKPAARLFIYGQMLGTWDLWACGSSWKITYLHIIGIATSLSLDTTTPHHAAYGLLLHSCSFLFIVISPFNKDKHARAVSQPFSSPLREEHVLDIEWDQLPLFAPHLFDIMELINTDDYQTRTIGHQIF